MSLKKRSRMLRRIFGLYRGKEGELREVYAVEHRNLE
jgi:hypothetical protein